ncbi:MAG: deoxyribonuclease IV [Candidatus Micrarchaeaceae archaeon]
MANVRFGFHLSIKGGVLGAATAAASKKYGVFQLFVSNPRSWNIRQSSADQALQFSRLNSSHNIAPFAHMPYLCNIASPKQDILGKSIESGIGNISECNRLGIEYLVFHMGSHLGAGHANGKENIKKALSIILDSTKKCEILLENSAGYRNSMGSTIQEMASVIEDIDSSRIGVCLDTCHLFAAGYDLRNEKAIESLEIEFDRLIGIKRLKLVHLNDSKYGLGRGLDRHWHIGKGYIGAGGFLNIFRSRLFRGGPFVMETPHENENSESADLSAALGFYNTAKMSE